MTFSRRKIVLTSTPTVRGKSRIEAAMGETGWRVYEIPCPHCDHRQPWEWEALRWDAGKPSTAMLHCRSCGAGIDERDKRELLDLGRWSPLHPEREDGRAYGYHLTALCAPYGWTAASWPALAQRWERSAGDSERRRAFVNLALARTYDETEEATIDPDSLMARAETYPADVPAGAVVLTAGVDVQQDRLECSVWGWGAGEESWLIAHRVLTGDPSGPQVWSQLDDLLRRRWAHQSGGLLTVDAACVDSGYMAQTVQAWCSERRARHVYAVKGSAEPARPLWPQRQSTGHGKRPVYVLGVGAAKDSLWRRVQRTDPGAGYVHLPVGVDQTTCDQLLAERPRQEHGRTVWVRQRGVRAEALDCAVYAYAALASLGPTGRVIDVAAARVLALPRVEVAARPATKAAPRPRQGGSWLDAGARR